MRGQEVMFPIMRSDMPHLTLEEIRSLHAVTVEKLKIFFLIKPLTQYGT